VIWDVDVEPEPWPQWPGPVEILPLLRWENVIPSREEREIAAETDLAEILCR
jgi:hypothetical protein